MSRDYAHKRKRPPGRQVRGRNALPGWVWLCAGLSMGLAVAAAVWVMRPVAPMPGAGPASPATARAPEQAKVELPPKQESRFSFYELLPAYEVVVPPAPQPARPGQKPPPPVAEPGQYLIQVGSFRAQGDAEAQKARLALLGIESRVERVTIDNRDTWYRVRIGPINDPARVHTLVTLLNDNGVDSFLMRVRE